MTTIHPVQTEMIVIGLVLVAALFGGLILVAVRFIFVRRRMGRDRLSYRVLHAMAWGSLALTVVVQWISGVRFGIALWFLIVAMALVMGMIIGQYRRCRREALLLMISTAVERQLPLGPVLAMFGSESIGWNDQRGRVLAAWLEQGMPLDEALSAAGEPLGDSAGVLVRMGRQVDDLRGALACLTPGFQQYQSLWRAAVSRLCYIVAIMASVMTFVMVNVVPSFQKVFHDFNMPLPKLTQLVIRGAHFFTGFGGLFFLPLLAICLYAIKSYVGDARLDLPGLRRLLLPFHTSTIMQALSLSAERQQPLSPAIKLLAQTYPRRFVRRRLARVETRIDRGEDWLESLQAERLMRGVDAAVLRAGERVGNLPWALRELADGNLRRLTFRLQALGNLMFPVLLLLTGAAVGVFVVGLFIPLTTLIESLAR